MAFDFEKLEVYKKAKVLSRGILDLTRRNNNVDPYLRDQLKRASMSVVINIAEGSGRFTKKDKKNFYTIARGSVYECASLLEIIKDDGKMSEQEYKDLYSKYEEISKMLLGLIRSQE